MDIDNSNVEADIGTDFTTDAEARNYAVVKDASGNLYVNVPWTDVDTDTDTHYASSLVVAGSSSAKADTSSALTNGNVYLNHVENDAVTDHHSITGSGATSVTTDSSGNIIIASTDTTYSSQTAAQNGTTVSLVTTGEKYTWNSKQDALVAGTDYQTPLVAGTDYQTPLVAGTDYQTPLTAGTDYQTPLEADVDYQTPLEADVDYQTPLVAGTDYQVPLTAGTDYQTPLVAGTDYVVPESGKGLFSGSYTDLTSKPTLGTAAACDTGTSSGNVPVLNSSGKLSNDVIPTLAIGDYVENSVGTYANLVNLSTAEKGDISKVTAETGADINKNGVYWLNGTYSTASSWIQIVGPSNVISVNGSTGVVTGLATVTGTEALTNKTINGYTPGAAMAKGVDTSVSSSSTNDNVPTSAAVFSAINSDISTATVSVPATGGSVTVSGMTANAIVWVSPAPASYTDYAASGCRCSAQGSDSLTFTVTNTASSAMSVNIAWKKVTS